MRAFFAVLSIVLVGFIYWCHKTHQPKETNYINVGSLTLAVMFLRQDARKK